MTLILSVLLATASFATNCHKDVETGQNVTISLQNGHSVVHVDNSYTHQFQDVADKFDLLQHQAKELLSGICAILLLIYFM